MEGMLPIEIAPVVFYFVRHGKTQFNRDHKVQGWCDSPLIDEGVATARRTGTQLAPVTFARAYASDLGRTRQTLAELLDAHEQMREAADRDAIVSDAGKASPSTPRAARILRGLDQAFEAPVLVEGIPVRCDARLREWCYGDLEQGPGEMLHQRLVEGFGEELSFAEENARLPETADNLARLDASGRAERFADVTARLDSFLHEAGTQTLEAGGGNVVCTTHAFTVRTLMYMLDPTRVNDPLVIKNGSLTRIAYDGKDFTLLETGVVDPVFA